MAQSSRELKGGAQIAALAALARRREASLRAAVTRAMQALNAARATEQTCRRACEAQRLRWHEALARGGVYGQRALGAASQCVEAERAALVDAVSALDASAARAAQSQADLQVQQELLQDNARKQEKLRELLASLQPSRRA